MTIEREKKEEIKKLTAMAKDNMNTAAVHLMSMIALCETDKGDDRYDALHDIKNRITVARKRLKRLAYMDDEGELIKEG